MSNRVIAIDVDDVLTNFNETLLNHVNYLTNKNYKIEDLKADFTNLEERDRELAVSNYDSWLVHANLKFFDGAIEFVENCAELGLEIVFVTSVYPEAVPFRNSLLCNTFEHLKHSIIYTTRKDLVKSYIIIDDMARNLEENLCPNRILLRRPWNEDSFDAEFIVNTLDQAYKVIKYNILKIEK